MALPQQLAVSNVPNAGASSLGAIVDCGPTQNGARTFSINSASLSTGDQVQVLGSNDGFVADAFVIGYLNTSDSTAPGQNSALVSPYTARYLRTYRVLGTAALTVEAAENSPSAGGGGGGGSTGPLTSMTPFVQPNLAAGGNIGTNAVTTVDTYTSFDVDQTAPGQALTFIAPTSPTVDKVEFVSADGSASFTMYGQTIIPGTFGVVKFNSVSGSYTPASYAALGGNSLGGDLAIGTLDAHNFGLLANGKTYATSDGTTTTLGIAPGSVAAAALTLQGGSGGVTIQTTAGGVTINGDGAVQILATVGNTIVLGGAGEATLSLVQSTTGSGVATLNSSATGDVNLGTGAGGVDPGAKTIRVGTGAAAKTVLVGSTNSTSTTTVSAGSGGVAIDATGGAATLGATSATSVTVGNAAAPTRINTTGLGFNGAAGATAIIDANASTTQGVRFPNMTTTQKNAIANTAGLVVFDTTLGKLCVNTGAGWQTITSA